jgi:hypothetical protein
MQVAVCDAIATAGSARRTRDRSMGDGAGRLDGHPDASRLLRIDAVALILDRIAG